MNKWEREEANKKILAQVAEMLKGFCLITEKYEGTKHIYTITQDLEVKPLDFS